MKILFQYLKPHKWLVILTLILAAINIGFSLIDPILLGKMVNLANEHQSVPQPGKFDWPHFFWSYEWTQKKGSPYLHLGVFYILIFSISVAMGDNTNAPQLLLIADAIRSASIPNGEGEDVT